MTIKELVAIAKSRGMTGEQYQLRCGNLGLIDWLKEQAGLPDAEVEMLPKRDPFQPRPTGGCCGGVNPYGQE